MHTCTVVEQNKAIITYVQLLKEDLAIFRLVPDNGVVPEYDAGQFITIGMPIPTELFNEGGKIIRRAWFASHPEWAGRINQMVQNIINSNLDLRKLCSLMQKKEINYMQ